MSNQDLDGKTPANEPFGAAAGPAATPESLEQQLAKERDARVQMRDRLRHTEALAAESHALRSRMAQELERVTADRDRLRTAAAGAPAPGPAGAALAPPVAAPPPMTPRFSERPLMPPAPPPRSGPWRALAMLGGLAAGVAALAWITGTLPGSLRSDLAGASAPAATSTQAASASSPAVAAVARSRSSAAPLAIATATPAAASAFALPEGAVALPPLTPEQQLAAAPSAAGPAPAPAPAAPPAAQPSGMAARLHTALAGEGIAAPVEVDAATGHVMVADPQADYALRDRTDLVIRAVYAGASLPEPQIEHRWISPKRGERPVQAAAAPPQPVAKPVQAANVSTAAAAYAARHAAAENSADRHKKAAAATVADAEELRAVLPEGRVTAGCRASLAGKSSPHRADMTACMKHSCCASAANHQAEDCKAYEKSYPFTCSAG